MLLDSFIVINLTIRAIDVFIAHSVNAFAHAAEWIPVYASAIAIGFLAIAAARPSDTSILMFCALFLVVNALVGVVGCYLHLAADMHVPAESVKDSFLYGPPVLAPLLFPNLALLGILGIMGVVRSSTFLKENSHYNENKNP